MTLHTLSLDLHTLQHAYASGGDVYFNVLSFPEYGRLSGHRIDDVHQGVGGGAGCGHVRAGDDQRRL